MVSPSNFSRLFERHLIDEHKVEFLSLRI